MKRSYSAMDLGGDGHLEQSIEVNDHQGHIQDISNGDEIHVVSAGGPFAHALMHLAPNENQEPIIIDLEESNDASDDAATINLGDCGVGLEDSLPDSMLSFESCPESYALVPSEEVEPVPFHRSRHHIDMDNMLVPYAGGDADAAAGPPNPHSAPTSSTDDEDSQNAMADSESTAESTDDAESNGDSDDDDDGGSQPSTDSAHMCEHCDVVGQCVGCGVLFRQSANTASSY